MSSHGSFHGSFQSPHFSAAKSPNLGATAAQLHGENHIMEIVPLSEFLKSALQTSLGMFAAYAPTFVVLFFMTRNNDEFTISSYGLGLMWSNAFGNSCFFGLSCGLQTVISHPFGSQNFTLVGQYLNQHALIMLLLFIPIFGILFFSSFILRFINSDFQLVLESQQFCRLYLPQVFFSGIYYSLTCYLNGQCIYDLQMYTMIAGFIVNFGVSYYFIEFLDWGLYGAAITFNIYMLFCTLMIIALMLITKKGTEHIQKFDKQALKGWGEYLKIAVPVGLILFIEWLSYQFYSLISSNLPMDQFNAFLILTTLEGTFYQIPEGIAMATTTYVGNEMGRENVAGAKKYSIYGICTIVGVHISVIFPLYFTGDLWIKEFTNSADVEKQIKKYLIIFLIVSLTDALQSYGTGIVRGIGRETAAFISKAICYLGIGLIFSYVFAYPVHWELLGVFFGQGTGMIIYFIILVFIIIKSDWKKLAQHISDRIAQVMFSQFQLDQQKDKKIGDLGGINFSLTESLDESLIQKS